RDPAMRPGIPWWDRPVIWDTRDLEHARRVVHALLGDKWNSRPAALNHRGASRRAPAGRSTTRPERGHSPGWEPSPTGFRVGGRRSRYWDSANPRLLGRRVTGVLGRPAAPRKPVTARRPAGYQARPSAADQSATPGPGEADWAAPRTVRCGWSQTKGGSPCSWRRWC